MRHYSENAEPAAKMKLVSAAMWLTIATSFLLGALCTA
jgi:hypothetical protein